MNNLPAKTTETGLLRVMLGLKSKEEEDRFLAIMLREVTKPEFSKCTKISKINCARSLAILGLEPDPVHKLVHLIPYGSTLTVQVDYKGKIELAIRDGVALSVTGNVVRENDKYRHYVDENGTHLLHEIDRSMTVEQRGEIIAAWTRWVLPNCPEPFIHTIGEVEKEAAYRRSQQKDKLWKTDPDSMWLKTCYHNGYKVIPKLSRRLSYSEILDVASDEGKSVNPEDYQFGDAENVDFEDVYAGLLAPEPMPNTNGERIGFNHGKTDSSKTEPEKTKQTSETKIEKSSEEIKTEEKTAKIKHIRKIGVDKGLDTKGVNDMSYGLFRQKVLTKLSIEQLDILFDRIEDIPPMPVKTGTDKEPESPIGKPEPVAQSDPGDEQDDLGLSEHLGEHTTPPGDVTDMEDAVNQASAHYGAIFEKLGEVKLKSELAEIRKESDAGFEKIPDSNTKKDLMEHLASAFDRIESNF